MNNYCSSCGKQLKEDDKFCSSCGVQISTYTSSQTSQFNLQDQGGQHEKTAEIRPNVASVSPISTMKPRKKSGCLKVFLLVLSGFFILFVIGTILLLFNGDDIGDYEDVMTSTTILERAEEETYYQVAGDIEVMLPPFVLENEESLVVKTNIKDSIIEEILAEDDEEVLQIVELHIDGYDSFSGFFYVKVPINKEWFESEENPNERVLAYTYNEELGELEPELVKIEDGHIVFAVNHFSKKIIVKAPENSLKSKVRVGNMLSVSEEDVLSAMQSIKGGEEKKETLAKLGLKSLEAGTGWASNFATYTAMMDQSKAMEKTYSGLSVLGNVIFYLKCSEAILNSYENENYEAIANQISSDGLGFIVSNFAGGPIQVAYTSTMMVQYIGEQTSAYMKEIHDKKFKAVLPDMMEIYIESEVNKIVTTGRKPDKLDWKYRMINKLYDKALTSESPEVFQRTIDNLIYGIADRMLTSAEFELQYKELVENYAGDHMGDSLADYFGSKKFEDVPEEAHAELRVLIGKEFEPILSQVAYRLKEKSYKDAYEKSQEIIKAITKEHDLNFVIEGDLPKAREASVYEFYDSQAGATLYDFSATGNMTEKSISYETYHDMGYPDTIRLIIIHEGGVDKYQMPYTFKKENQTFTFDIGMIEEEEEEKEEKEDKKDDEEKEDENIEGERYWLIGDLKGEYTGTYTIVSITKYMEAKYGKSYHGREVVTSLKINGDDGSFTFDGILMDLTDIKVEGNSIYFASSFFDSENNHLIFKFNGDVHGKVLKGAIEGFEREESLMSGAASFEMISESNSDNKASTDYTGDFSGTFYITSHTDSEYYKEVNNYLDKDLPISINYSGNSGVLEMIETGELPIVDAGEYDDSIYYNVTYSDDGITYTVDVYGFLVGDTFEGDILYADEDELIFSGKVKMKRDNIQR